MSADDAQILEETPKQENDSEATTPCKRPLCNDEEASKEIDEKNKRRKTDNYATTNHNDVVVKKEPEDGIPTTVESSNEVHSTATEASTSNSIPVTVKSEPAEQNDVLAANAEKDDNAASTSTGSTSAVVVKAEPASSATVAVKTEPTSSATTEPTNSKQSQTSPADCSVSSSTLRPSCRFGIRCYRQNPAHRNADAHPGDSDYRRPSFPMPPLGTPNCSFGNSCYRRNPVHFQQFSHPSDFNSAQNIRNRLRQRRAQTQSSNGRAADDSDLGSDEEEDPFRDEGGSDLDYNPGAKDDADDDDDDEDELEFNSERQNCDDYD